MKMGSTHQISLLEKTLRLRELGRYQMFFFWAEAKVWRMRCQQWNCRTARVNTYPLINHFHIDAFIHVMNTKTTKIIAEICCITYEDAKRDPKFSTVSAEIPHPVSFTSILRVFGFDWDVAAVAIEPTKCTNVKSTMRSKDGSVLDPSAATGRIRISIFFEEAAAECLFFCKLGNVVSCFSGRHASIALSKSS